MHSIRLSCALGLALALVLAADQQARANVYAAHLTPAAKTWNFNTDGPLTLSYRLNEAATSVTVEIYRASDPGTVIKSLVGGTSYGLNQVVWDGTDTNGQPVAGAGDYKFRVKAEHNTGYAVWTNITPTSEGSEIRDAQFAGPTGIAVNRFPSSPNFGRIYVSNASDSLTTPNPNLTTGDGLWILNSDMTFRGGSMATAAAAANGQLVTLKDPALDTAFVSPWKIAINADNPDEIVMTDFRNGFENCWIFDGEGQNVYRVLDSSTTGPTTGAAYNHGNIIFAQLTGTGINRKLWVIDEDKDIGTPVVPPVGGGFDVIRHDIGTNSVNHTAQGTEIINGGAAIPGGGNLYTDREFRWAWINGTRKLFFACRRANNTDPNMAAVCYNVDEHGTITGHAWSKLNTAMSAATGVTWILTGTVAVDEVRNRLAIGRDGGASAVSRVAILNPEDGAYVTSFPVAEANSTLRSMDFDAAGNLYTVDTTSKHVRMWSPPDGPNSYTTPYAEFIAINCEFPPPTITKQPVGSQVCPGTSYTFTVEADGHGAPLAFEWRKGSTVVGIGPSLTLNPVTLSDSGSYTVVVTGCSSVTSDAAVLSVTGAPIITQQPVSAGIFVGEGATFSVTATAAGTPSYQWKRVVGGNTENVGTNSPTYSVTDASSALNGAKYYVEVTDSACGGVTVSNQATLNVLRHPCPLRFADLDFDLDIDSNDFGILQPAIGGAEGFDPDQHRCADRNTPFGEIDEQDLTDFYACMTQSAPEVPSDPACGRTVLFTDDFDSAASAANWTVVATPFAEFDANNNPNTTPDATVIVAYDYGAVGIPPAPNSAGTTLGLRASVNDRDDVGTDPLEAVVAFTNLSFSGDFIVQFDLWCQHAGSGTTEHALMGVNGTVPTPTLTAPTLGAAATQGVSPVALGYLFAVAGDSGDTLGRDYRTYIDGLEGIGFGGGYSPANQESTTGTVFPPIFPVPKALALGAPGNSGTALGWGWVRVEIQQKAGNLTWKMNDAKLAELAVSGSSEGRIMLGHMDLFASVNPGQTYVIFDNLVVLAP
ncbi:MAG: hypothetical protein AMXMBFR83_12830 [Phycisphaerae bacterium]